jgi:hypothetical protein
MLYVALHTYRPAGEGSMRGQDMWRERAASVQGRDKQSATDTRSVRVASMRHALHTSAYVSIRQHTSAYVRDASTRHALHTSAYVSIRQRRVYMARPAYASIRQHTSATDTRSVRDASMRHALHTLACVSMRQHTSACVSIREHT